MKKKISLEYEVVKTLISNSFDLRKELAILRHDFFGAHNIIIEKAKTLLELNQKMNK